MSTVTSIDPAQVAENRDALEHLTQNGFGRLLIALQDPRCTTRAGRAIPAAIARRLRITPERASQMLAEARALLS